MIEAAFGPPFSFLGTMNDEIRAGGGTQVAQHPFSAACYTPRSHPRHVDVNVRCLDGIEIEKLTVRPFDGRGDWEQSRAALGD